MKIGLIGLGAVGMPIASSLLEKYGDDFLVLGSSERVSVLEKESIEYNDKLFNAKFVSEKSNEKVDFSLIIISVKNYSLNTTLDCLKKHSSSNTVFLPLENGLFAFDFFSTNFPNNKIIHGFVQGPNTKRIGNSYIFTKYGTIHIGALNNTEEKIISFIIDCFKGTKISLIKENDILKAKWKKIMLNVAGNSITALTEMDYLMIKHSPHAINLFKKTMNEVRLVANSIGIKLTEKDVEDVLHYFLTYPTSKQTSMLDDKLAKRQTENEYLSGYVLKIAKQKSIDVPYIETLYSLVKITENVYLNKFSREA